MSTRIFDLVHTDIVGPFRPTKKGNRYFLTIVDNYSRFGFVCPMKNKSDTFQIFKDFAVYVYNQFDRNIRRIQSDRGGEFMSAQFQGWMRRNGIVHQTSAPYTPQHNGVAERRNGVLQTMMRCLMEDSNLPNFYWTEALRYASYIINRTWSSVTNQTPFYRMYGYRPNIGNLRIFGAYAMVNIPLQQRTKGGPVSERLRFIGIDPNSKYYKFADNHHRVVVSNSAKFEEDSDWSRIHSNDTSVYFSRDVVEGTAKPDVENSRTTVPDTVSVRSKIPSSRVADDVSSDEVEDADDGQWSTVVRRSKRTTKGVPPKRYQQQVSNKNRNFRCNKVTLPPENFSQIKHLPELEQDKWHEAMQSEMDCLDKLKVYTPVSPPTQKPIVGTRWIYRIKEKPNGEQIYKARLVAQGFSQRYPEDYTETFSPTVRNESVKIALITAVALNLEVFQFDVETAYLNADLHEEIYVKAAPGYQNKDGDVWFLHKSLYGLKQSALMWHRCLIDKLNSMGFIKSNCDKCVFTKRSGDAYEIVLVYVDDIVYIGPNKEMSELFAKDLEKHFTLKSLGPIHDYLGVQIEKTQKGFSLTQEIKIEQLLLKCNMADASPCRTPMQTDFYKATKLESQEFEDQTLYRSVIGSLLYISSWTRPDIALSVNVLSRYVGKATRFHWTCIKRLLRYMKHTKNMKLLLEPTHNDIPEVECFVDADWAGEREGRRSTSGFIMFLNGCPIVWKVKKQNYVSCSSTEAEYACMSECFNELTCISALIERTWREIKKPVIVNEDNVAVTFIAESEYTGSRSRHIEIRYENSKDYVQKGLVKLQYLPTTEQIADILNKPLPIDQHEYLTKKMCLSY